MKTDLCASKLRPEEAERAQPLAAFLGDEKIHTGGQLKGQSTLAGSVPIQLSKVSVRQSSRPKSSI